MKIPPVCEDLVPRTPEAFLDPVLISAWDEFIARYPLKKDCLDEIVSVLLASGLLFCRKCNQQNWEKPEGRTLVCQDCNTTRSATAGTFFDHMRSYRAWLAAIWFVERGILLSSTVFQKLLNIAHSSARLLLKRVMAAMQAPMQEGADTLKVPTAVLVELFRRRSRETKAGEHPRTEEDAITEHVQKPELETEQPTAKEQEKGSEVLSEVQRAILKLLAEKPLNSNQLASQTGLPIPEVSACLSMLEMDGLCVRLPGNQFATAAQSQRGGAGRRSIEALSDAAIAAVKEVRRFLDERFNGVSRKHLQTYLIAHWCSMRGRERNNKQEGDYRTVLDACLKLGKKTSSELFSQITPPMVLIYASACTS